MAFKVDLIPSAYQDLQEALEYYYKFYPYLSEKFYLEFDNVIHSLEKNPFFEIKYASVRSKHLKSFPYNVHFIVDEKVSIVTIIAIVFSKQEKTNFQSRLD